MSDGSVRRRCIYKKILVDLWVKVTPNVVQYPLLHHVTYVPEKFNGYVDRRSHARTDGQMDDGPTMA